MSGKFVTFEGIDGSGKTTQLHAVARWLAEEGHTVLVTREPGGTPIGEQIRQILLRRRNSRMAPLCELMLMAAARAQHVQEIIAPTVNAGHIVLSDRYSDATWAYQHGGRGIPEEDIRTLCTMAEQERVPDLTFVYDLPCEEALQRVHDRNSSRMEGEVDDTRFDEEKLAFHERVRAFYKVLAERHPDRIVVIDASAEIPAVTAETIEHLSEFLG